MQSMLAGNLRAAKANAPGVIGIYCRGLGDGGVDLTAQADKERGRPRRRAEMTMRMKFVVVALVLLAGGGLAIYHLYGHGHSHGRGAGAGLQLNAGQKWKTDQRLREGMERIRELVIAASPTGSASDMDVLANGIQQQVDNLIANCKLQPAADETLHVMIADLLEGADLVIKRSDPPRGIALMRKALQTYPKYFDHAGWPGLGDT